MNRRDLFKVVAALPFVALGVKAAHVHDYQPDLRFFGYSCECGAEVANTELRQVAPGLYYARVTLQDARLRVKP